MNLLCDDGIMSWSGQCLLVCISLALIIFSCISTWMIQALPSKGNLDTIQSTTGVYVIFRHIIPLVVYIAFISAVSANNINWQNCRNYNHFHPLLICKLYDVLLTLHSCPHHFCWHNFTWCLTYSAIIKLWLGFAYKCWYLYGGRPKRTLYWAQVCVCFTKFPSLIQSYFNTIGPAWP